MRSQLWVWDRPRIFVGLAVLATVYFIAASIGDVFTHPATGVPLIWLPSGIALAAIFLLGLRFWPAVWIASFLAHWFFIRAAEADPHLPGQFLWGAIATGDTLGAIVGAYMLERFVRGGDPCLCARSFLRFAVLCAGGASAVGATCATIGFVVTGDVRPDGLLSLWFDWWLAQAVGIVVMTPLILAWSSNRRIQWKGLRTIEGLIAFGLLAALGGLVLTGGAGLSVPTWQVSLLLATVLVWFAVRFGQRETTVGVFVLALMAGWAAVSGRTPFGEVSTGQSVLVMQIAMGVVSVSSMGLAAGIDGRRRGRRRLDIYRMAAVQTADHWMITDADGVVIEVNPAFEKITGYCQRELVGKKPNVIKSGVHDKAFYEKMWETLLSGEPYRGIVVNRRKNGELFHEMKTITPIKDENGRTTHFLSIGKDITDLKRAEDELRKSTSNLEQTNQQLTVSEAELLRHVRILESVLSSSKEGVIVVDRDGRFLMFNPAATQIIGIGATESEPSQWTALYGAYLPDRETPYPTEDLPLVRAIRGEHTDNVEMFIRNPNKKGGVWLSISGRPLTDRSGSVIGGVIVARDITQDKWAITASAELKANRQELQIAERIQKRFFPRTPPSEEGIDIGGASRPAVVTGGDYFDYLRTPDGNLLLVVGDVSGHGFGPALLMASVRAYVHALTASGVQARDMLSVVNRLIASDTRSGDFVTLVLARVDLETRVCEYASAGHPTGYVLDSTGAVKYRLESVVPPLGILPEIDLKEMSKFDLQDGDLLLMLTDGITEAENSGGACFNEECVLEVVRQNRHRRASEIVDILHKTVAEHCEGKLRDDVTSIVVKFQPRVASDPLTKRIQP